MAAYDNDIDVDIENGYDNDGCDVNEAVCNPHLFTVGTNSLNKLWPGGP